MTDFTNTLPSEDDDVEIVYSEETGGEDNDNTSGEQPSDAVDTNDDASFADDSDAATGDDDAQPLPGEETDEPDDAEYKNYSVGVKKRIKREIRLRKQVAQELGVATQQREQILNIAKNGEVAYLNLQKQHDTLQENYYKLLDTALQNSIDQKTRELQTAREQGDTAAEIQAQSAVEELRFNKRQLTEVATSFSSQKAQREQQKPQLQQIPSSGVQPAAPPLALQWIARNSWIREEKYAPHREYIKQVDAKLLAAGYSPHTELYYTEMDKELRRAFPSTPRPQVMNRSKQGRSIVTPSMSGSGGRNAGSRRIVLTKTDMQTMRTFGLDPANKQHVLAFAKERINSKGA
jgi:hypothetical protein